MKPLTDPDRTETWNGYLETIRAIPFIKHARIIENRTRAQGATMDAWLEIEVKGHRHRLMVEVKEQRRLQEPTVHTMLHRMDRGEDQRWVLFTPYVAPGIAEQLIKRHINFVDRAGNLHFETDGLLAHVEGKRPLRPLVGQKMLGANAYRVTFALLARPEKLNAPIREIATMAGVGKTVAADALQRLQGDGLLVRTRTARRIANEGLLIDRWVQGYADVLRPRLLLGTYRTQMDPPELEREVQRLERTRGDAAGRWAWGGGAAAHKLEGHFRGELTVIHLERPWPELPKQLKAVRAEEGNLVLLGVPGPAAFPIGADAALHLAHPLLVYAELLAMNHERAQEAATELRRLRIDRRP